ncbi:MAG TPA: hypothetical protein VK508_05195 [Cyclobacteriaceae bacterium]|nr:hypothetical protein [Cyclobacteriaceae bacterium]
MKKVKQTRLFSVALVIVFLATSTLTRVVAGNNAGDSHSSCSIQTQPEAPYGADQQFPFEEKEKEFEDKSEAAGDTLVSNLFFICFISSPSPDISDDFKGICYYNSSSAIPGPRVPLFLSNRTILI